jgi:hypothetical protein
VSLACGVVFAVLVVATAQGRASGDVWVVAGMWGTGLAALLGGFAACRIDEDPTDDPKYLASLGQGLRSEWQRGHRAP